MTFLFLYAWQIFSYFSFIYPIKTIRIFLLPGVTFLIKDLISLPVPWRIFRGNDHLPGENFATVQPYGTVDCVFLDALLRHIPN